MINLTQCSKDFSEIFKDKKVNLKLIILFLKFKANLFKKELKNKLIETSSNNRKVINNYLKSIKFNKKLPANRYNNLSMHLFLKKNLKEIKNKNLMIKKINTRLKNRMSFKIKIINNNKKHKEKIMI